MRQLACQKDQFFLPANLHYLNCAYMSPQSRRVAAAGEAGLARQRVPTGITAGSFFDESDQLRERFARLIGAPDPQRIAILAAVSYGIATVARNTALARGQSIVVLGGQFPSNYYSWSRRCRETGAELRVVPAPGDGPARGARWNQALLEAIDRSTAAVAIPNAHWSDGTLFDLRAIRARTREVGAALVIDGTQTVGALPFDVNEIDPDALICAGYKTLYGPYGIALGYFGSRYDDGVPLEESWAPRVDSDDFARLVDYREDYRPKAVRYDVGERGDPILVPMAIAALDQVLEWTPSAIRAYCDELTRGPIARARALGFRVEDEGYRCAHLFGLRPPAGLAVDTIAAALAAHRVTVSLRGDAIRVSPQVYNDAGDLEALIAALSSCLARA